MNWGDFKKAIEAAGISDDTKILAMDTLGVLGDEWNLVIRFEPGGILIFANDKSANWEP